jgi:hypothetical protein
MCLSNSAVFVAGRLNVSVGWAILITCGIRCAISMPRPEKYASSLYLKSFGLLWFLLLYSTVLIFICPLLFGGTFKIMPGSSLFNPELAVQYDFVTEMATQTVYFSVALASLLPIYLHLSKMDYDQLARLIDQSFFVAGVFTGSVAIWHFLNNEFGVYFPDSFFHNERSAGAWDQGYVGGVRRVSGAAAEPSALAAYTAVFLYYSSARLVRFEWRWALLAALSFFVLMISTSTTGYFLLAALLVCMTAYIFAWVYFVRNAKALAIAARTMGSFLFVVIIGLVYFAVNFDQYKGLIEFTLDKGSSTSAYERGFANNLSYEILFGTYGLGAGLGSHRASGLFFVLISSIGVLGALVYLYFQWQMVSVLFKRIYYVRPAGLHILSVAFTILGLLIPSLVSAANLIDPMALLFPCFLVALQASFRSRHAGEQAPVRRTVFRDAFQTVNSHAHSNVDIPEISDKRAELMWNSSARLGKGP